MPSAAQLDELVVDRQLVPFRSHTKGVVSACSKMLDGSERRCVVVTMDDTYKNGAMSADDGEVLTSAATIAYEEQCPLVIFAATTGPLIGDGTQSLAGLGHAAKALVRCSGVVPIIAVITDPVLGSAALLLGLVDFVIITDKAVSHVNDPELVHQVTGINLTSEQLGGKNVLTHEAGVTSLIATDATDAEALVSELLQFLPANNEELPDRCPTDDPVDRPCAAAENIIPASPTGGYDMRTVVEEIVDDGYFFEIRQHWAPNIITGFASVGGITVGVVGNQPLHKAGTLDIEASQKGARFVAFCDAFAIPLLTLVDTPGFFPGKDEEWRGMIRKGAQLAFAYARASVPRVCITTRKSYGGAFIVMDSKTMGNDLSFAWPSAEIAVMGAAGAVEILHRRLPDDEKAQKVIDYEDHFLNPFIAAERGYIDAVIDPTRTRLEVAQAFDLLSSKREKIQRRKHDNTPL